MGGKRMQKFFEEVYKKRLTRKEPSLFYTIGDESLNHSLILDQGAPALSPSKTQIEDFAGLVYLYGILGFRAEEFTAVPLGYITTLENENSEVATLIVSEATLGEYISKIKELLTEKIMSPETKVDETEFFNEVLNEISGVKTNFEIVEACAKINSILIKKPGLERIKKSIDSAIGAIDFNGENSVNKRNCENNQILIERVCRGILKLPLFGKLSENDEKRVVEMGNEFLNKLIFKFYKEYINGEPQNLLEDEVIAIFKESFGNNPDFASIIMNVCSTDFSADMIAKVLIEIGKCDDIEKFNEEFVQVTGEDGRAIQPVINIVPDTPDNVWKKNRKISELLKKGWSKPSEFDK